MQVQLTVSERLTEVERKKSLVELLTPREKDDEISCELEISGRLVVMKRLTTDALQARLIAESERRMNEGARGKCLNCEEQISPKRLEAIPYAVFCVKCQDLVDRHEIPGFEHLANVH